MGTTTQDLLRRGLEIVDSYAVWQSDVVGVGHDAEALRAVAAVVRRELEALADRHDVRERLEELLDVLVTAAQRYGAAHGTDYVPCMEGVEMGKARRAVVAFVLLRTQRGEGEEADALDLLRWAESRAAALEPVAGNIMPPGTYACYVEGVGGDPAEYEDAGEPYLGPGILGAIRAARRGEGGGDGEHV